MVNWTNKQWGAIIGALVVFAIVLVGAGITALAVIPAVAGYFVGKFLDGELDLQEIQNRAQERFRDRTQSPLVPVGPVDQPPYTPGPTSGPAASPEPPAVGPGGMRVR